MKYTKALFLSMVFLMCSAEGCPSECEKQSDCDEGETCRGGTDGDGRHANWCFADNPSAAQVSAAQAANWRLDSVTVGTSGVSATIKRTD